MPDPANAALVGLRAVLDMSQFTAGSRQYETILSKMSSATKSFINKNKGVFSDSNNELTKFQQMVERAQSITFGIFVADSFRAIGRGINEAASEAFHAVSVFQQLEIQMNTLAARNYAQAYGVTIPEALQKTEGQARNLLMWVRQLAVTSPFTVESLGTMFRMATAYGYTNKEAERMVKSVGNFTAALGLSDDVLERILYNFGQMKAQGKPTGRELRDIANSFVPVAVIEQRLAEARGITKAQVLEMMQSGQITAEQFIDETMDYFDESYTGAMERMSNTFVAAFGNLKDLIQSLLGYEILGPVMKRVAEDVQKFVTNALSTENYLKAELIGKDLLFVYDKLSIVLGIAGQNVKSFFSLFSSGAKSSDDFARSILTIAAYMRYFVVGMSNGVMSVKKFVVGIFEYFGTSFGTLSNNMAQWGANIVVAFAKGMATAISAVLSVIAGIGRAIAGLLEAHSPPLLLPELETWGTNAMMTYLEGWAKADFDVFDSIGDLIGKAINSWKGQISEVAVIENLIKSKVALSELIEGYKDLGMVSSGALTELSNAAGFAFDEMNKFITLSFQLMEAENIGKQLSSVFDFSGIGQVTVFDSVVDSFQDIYDIAGKFGSKIAPLLQSYALDSERLAEITDVLSQKQETLNQKTKYYDELLRSLEAQLNKVTDRQEDIGRIRVIDRTLAKTILTAYERERLELEKKQILLERQIRDTRLQKETEEGAISDSMDALKDEKSLLEQKLDQEKKNIQQISDANIASLKGQLEAVKQMIEAQIELNELMSKMKDIKANVGAGVDVEIDAIEIPTIDELMETIGAEVEDALNAMWEQIKIDVDAKMKPIKDAFAPLKEVWGTVVAEWKKVIEDPEFKKSWETFTSTIKKGIDNITGVETKGILESISALIGLIVTELFITTDKTGKSVLQILADSFLAITEAVTKNPAALSTAIDSITNMIQGKLAPEIKEILTYIGTTLIPKMIDFAINSVPVIMNVLGFMVDNYKTILLILGAIAAIDLVKSGFIRGLTLAIGALTLLKTLAPVLAGIGSTAPGTGLIPFLRGTPKGGGMSFGEYAKSYETGFNRVFPKATPNPTTFVKTLGKISAWATAIELALSLTGDTKMSDDEYSKLKEPNSWKWGDPIFDFGPKKDPTLNWFTGNTKEEQSQKWKDFFQPMLDEFDTISSTLTLSWQRFVDGFGGGSLLSIKTPDFGSIFEGLFDGETADGTKTKFRTWIEGIFGDEGTMSGVGGNTAISDWFSTTFGEGGSVTEWFSTSTTGFSTWLESIFGKDTGLFNTWLSDTFGDEGSIVTWFTTVFGEGGTIPTWFTTVYTNFDTWLDSIFGSEGLFNTWLAATFGEEGSIATWFSSAFGEEGTVWVWFETILTGIAQWFTDVFGPEGKIVDWLKMVYDFGVNLILGFWDGIASMRETVLGNILGFFQGIVTSIMGLLQEGSPSKLFEKIGVNAMKGLDNGFIGGAQAMTSPILSSSNVYNTNNTNVTVNPTYEQVQSPATIYNDISAALSAIRV